MVILLDNLEHQSTNGRIAEEGKCLMSLNRMALPHQSPTDLPPMHLGLL